MKIVSLVMNAAARDARVIKEAQSLIKAGHDVTVIGIKDNNFTGASALLDNGLQVHRIDWRRDAYERTASIYLRLLLLGVLLALIVLAGLVWAGQDAIGAVANAVAQYWRADLFANNGAGGGFWAGLARALVFAGKAVVFAVALGVVLLGGLIVLRKLYRLFDRGFLSKFRRIASTASAQSEDGKSSGGNLVYEFISAGPGRAVSDLSTDINDRILMREIKDVRIAKMTELALDLKPDVIHAHEVMTLPAATQIKKKTGAKIVYDAHELYEEIAQASPQVLEAHRRTHAEHLPNVDQIITVNDSIGAVYKSEYPFLPEPVIIKNATVVSELPVYDGRLHEAASLPRSQKILLYQGGFARKRGLEELVRAGALLPDGWSLVMVGWGNHEGELREIAAESVREWMTLMIAERRRRIVAGIPEELKTAIDERIERAYLKKPPPATKRQNNNDDADEDSDETDAAIGEMETAASHRATPRALMMAKLLKGESVDPAYDPFAYEDDPAVAAQEYALSTLVNLRLNKMNIDAPLSGEDYNKIRFIPPAAREELESWTQGATIGVIPYENDGLNHWFCSPNKLWEYPNAGVPILASNFPELNKVIAGNDIGWMLPSDLKAGDIARVINNLTDEEIAEKKDNCRAFMERDNWSVYEARLVECFASIASAPAKRPAGAKAPARRAKRASMAK